MPTLENVVVESKRRDGKAIKVDGNWYGAFNAAQLNDVNYKDTINLTFTTKEKNGTVYYNVQGNPSVVSAAESSAPASSGQAPARPAASGFPIAIDAHARSIVRQNSVTNAVKSLDYVEFDKTDAESVVDLVLSIAEKYEMYSCGDAERRAAEEMLASMNSE